MSETKVKERKKVKVKCPECKGYGYVMPCQVGNNVICECNTCKSKGEVTKYE